MVFVPTNGTLVTTRSAPRSRSSTKLCCAERSATVSRYVPARSAFTTLPDLVSLIVKPGPTVPRSVGAALFAPLPTATSSSAAAAAAEVAIRARNMFVTFFRLGRVRAGCGNAGDAEAIGAYLRPGRADDAATRGRAGRSGHRSDGG